jgi:hypothetical protein
MEWVVITAFATVVVVVLFLAWGVTRPHTPSHKKN